MLSPEKKPSAASESQTIQSPQDRYTFNFMIRLLPCRHPGKDRRMERVMIPLEGAVARHGLDCGGEFTILWRLGGKVIVLAT